MAKYLLFFIFSIILISCGPEKPKYLTSEQIEKEKQDIIKVIKSYNKAFQERNFAPFVDILSKDVIFFGTDSAETIKSLGEFQAALKKQWQFYDKEIYGEMSDISIQIDRNGTFASIIYGLPVDLHKNGNQQHAFLRYARTLKKEDGKWVIVSGIVGRSTVGESVMEILEKKK